VSAERTVEATEAVDAAAAVVVDRVDTPRGEVVLRRRGDVFEVVSNGVFLMDTSDGRSERLLVSAAVDASARRPASVLVCGLGVGFSLAAARADPRVGDVTVVEIERQLLAWHTTYLRHVTGAALSDSRVDVVVGDVVHWLRATETRFDVVCLDVDNGPHWTVSDSNASLYDDAGTTLLASRLRDDGVLAVWSAASVPWYEQRLRSAFRQVTAHRVAVERGEPDVVYVAVGPLRHGTESRR
jgi:spermidine synthase